MVALSTVEPEYHALAQATKEAIWPHTLLNDLNMQKYASKMINCDNQGAIALAKDLTYHARTSIFNSTLYEITLNMGQLTYCTAQWTICWLTS